MLSKSLLALLLSALAAVSAVPSGQVVLGNTPSPLFESLALQRLLHTEPELYQHIASLPEKRRVRLENARGVIEEHEITEGLKSLLVYQGIRFEDVTDEPQQLIITTAESAIPSSLSYSAKQLKPLFNDISTKRMREFLSHFTSFRTRYYRSNDGKQSQKWLLSQIEESIKDSKQNITVSEFSHTWTQSSIILHLPRDPQAKGKDELVIISAHQDSTNMLPFLSAPGADDDGSGTTTILEALRILVANNFTPGNHSVEFHWNSAEEGGLLGSQAIANDYQRRGIPVKAVLQMDMTAYTKPGQKEVIGIVQDFVNSDLTEFVETLVDEYAEIPVVKTKCGYACSDHASWTKTGVRSAFSIESTFENSNHAVHSTRDTIDAEGFSFDHMAQFVRLAIAYVKELSV